ncbi:hypothetical protein R70723_25550 [Paenibacillus sp. FSL R7-0273]|uniref:hypothetical protein n=1 Tax=Paenibacillus sp. FSL R7-0273 TaxID=1536772 RepID=UPI0004F5BE48|nr:hypothetical protein [Paenibacillus sp. FSL R7-0273]AIQ48900.1 hypothetical protein R70723_25550 [Paenibacillus sp. FSL R7-0273]OMF91223.1 hypothetical protein BK144_15980 [Paenibacillus sp. FSL R7-0273]
MLKDPQDGTRYYELEPLQQKILYAEKNDKDYGLYFTVTYDNRWSRDEIDQAVRQVMNAAEAFSGRIIRQGPKYIFAVDSAFKDYRSSVPLNGRRMAVFEGGLLAAYYLQEDECSIEFLMHHLIMDADSLYLFLDCLEQVLVNKSSPVLDEGSYFRTPAGLSKALPGTDGYADRIRQYLRPDQTGGLYTETVYGRGRLADRAYSAAVSLSDKLSITRFGVILLALALLSPQRRNLIGVAVSRRDQMQQAAVIGNFTDIVPLLLQIEAGTSYEGNARSLFKELFQAISGSALLSYEEYMELLGYHGYDYVVSYTGMPELEQRSAIFSRLTMGGYLYKCNNHLQFNEYSHHLEYEFCCGQPLIQHLCAGLEEMLLLLDRLDLSQPAGEPHAQAAVMETAAAIPRPAAWRKERTSHWFPDIGEDEDLHSSISSLDIAKMITDIYEHLGVQLSYQDIYTSGTLRELKQLILERVGHAVLPQWDAVEPDEYECPNFMKVLFIDSFRLADTNMYSVKYAYRISEQGAVELNALQAAIEHVIACNDVFFTQYIYADGEVQGKIGRKRHVEIEHITLADAAQLQELSGGFRQQGSGRLWDIRLVTLRSTGQTYLYLNMHPMLIDQIGLSVLLSQIEDSFNGKPVQFAQYAQIAASYKAAVAGDVQGWQPLLRCNAYPSMGKPVRTKGSYHHYEFTCQTAEAPYPEKEHRLLSSLTSRLALAFNQTQGYVGAVYHGRVIPGAINVVQSFARVLPVFFDTADDNVLRESLTAAHRYQAASIYDLNGAGFTLDAPAIVLQTLAAGSGEGSLFDQVLEFPGVPNFQLLLNFQLSARDCRISMYIDDLAYSPEEEARIAGDVQSALQELAQLYKQRNG